MSGDKGIGSLWVSVGERVVIKRFFHQPGPQAQKHHSAVSRFSPPCYKNNSQTRLYRPRKNNFSTYPHTSSSCINLYSINTEGYEYCF